jgi:GNAT superfamily N-acetyltransferase
VWLESWLAVESVRFDGAVRFVAAGPREVDEVLRVLDEAAAWLEGRGIEQWPSRFESSWVEGAIGRGETWLVEVNGLIAATVTMDWADAAWNGVPGNAAYLHRMAVRRRSAGLGAVILTWAAESAGQHGCDALRLDCVASNRGLRAYYEAAGFVFRGDVVVAGAPGQRLDDGPVTVVSRYELPIAGRRSG